MVDVPGFADFVQSRGAVMPQIVATVSNFRRRRTDRYGNLLHHAYVLFTDIIARE